MLRAGAQARGARAAAAVARRLAAHPRHAALAGLVGGLLAGPRAPGVAGWGGAVCLAGALVAAASGRGRAGAALALALAALALPAGAWLAQARLHALDRTRLGPWLGHAVDVRGSVLQPPRARAFGRTAVLVAVTAGPGRGERVLALTGAAVTAGVGDEVRVRGGLQALPPFEQAARRAGAHALLRTDVVRPTGRRRGGVLGVIDGVRRRAEAAFDASLPPSLAGLARGMVLGEDDALAPAMTEDFRASGLAHLVAASGSNVALLAALVLLLGAVLGVPRAPRLAGAAILIAAYVPLAGGGASIQRAGVMGLATLVAALASQPASRWYALLLAAAVTLARNPRAAQDPGWQLSFAAVIALLVLAPPLRDALSRHMPRPIAEALAVSLAAAAATAPLIALRFGRASWVTVPANVLAVPAVAPVMWLGVAAAALGQIAAPLGGPIGAVMAWPLAFIAWVGHAAAALPGANAEWTPPAWAAAGWWAALALLAIPAVRRRVRRPLAARRSRAPRGDGSGTTRGRVLAALALALSVAALAGAAGGNRGRAPSPAQLTITALDVGQGDATLIQHQGRTVLVDTGPPDGAIVERLRRAGVTRLDLLVVTHAQLDHDGGAAAVLAAFPTSMLLDGGAGRATPEIARAEAAATSRRTRVVTPVAGQRLRVGPITLVVLNPRPGPARLGAGEDPNRRAIVAELRDGAFRMLLTADAESDVLDTLPLEPVDVLKVAHHGSADEGLPALLSRLRPRAAIIEVGRDNQYGHPAPSVLAALARARVEVFRTDQDGTVALQP